ncbi:hypothetical protein GCM10009125_28700 [Castellaniella daejeonensis]|uniref:DUF91 domain-containing protein n=1 Tax=Castellaniella daejeonensis TaxID=659013 RepID=A0ABP3DSE5_9BURK
MATGDQCSQSVRHTRVCVSEKGKSATILNEDKEKFIKTQIDGCLVQNETSADWMVSKNGVGRLIIELKGVDISHAAEQVMETIDFLRRSGFGGQKTAGLIVGRRYPKFDTKVQKIKRDFSKKTGGPMHVVCRNREYVFEELFEFRDLT